MCVDPKIIEIYFWQSNKAMCQQSLTCCPTVSNAYFFTAIIDDVHTRCDAHPKVTIYKYDVILGVTERGIHKTKVFKKKKGAGRLFYTILYNKYINQNHLGGR